MLKQNEKQAKGFENKNKTKLPNGTPLGKQKTYKHSYTTNTEILHSAI